MNKLNRVYKASLSQFCHSHTPQLRSLSRIFQAAMATTFVKDVDVSKITFGPPQDRRRAGTGKLSYINYDGSTGGDYKWQTPPVKLTWGVSEWPKDNGEGKDRSLEVTFKPPIDERVKGLQKKFAELDEFILTTAKNNASLWGLPLNKAIDYYRGNYDGPFVRVKNNGDLKTVFTIDDVRPPTVFTKENGVSTFVKVEEGLKYVTKGSVVTILFHVVYVRYSTNKLGVKLAVKEICVLEKGGGASGDDFLDDEH